MEHLSLVLFTILAQCAAGLFFTVGLTQLRSPVVLHRRQIQGLNRGYLSALVILGLSLVVAFTHLGHPLRAFNVLYGLGHGSPLSIEIVSISAFGAVLLLVNIVQHKKSESTGLGNMLITFGLILAVWLVKAIANVYTLPSVPAWNTSLTTVQFFQSGLASGTSVAAMLYLGLSHPLEELQVTARKVIGWLGFLAIVLLAFDTVMLLVRLVDIGALYSMGDSHGLPVYLHAGLVLAGLLAWVAPAIRGHDARFSALVGVVLVMLGEILERIYFYDLLDAAVM